MTTHPDEDLTGTAACSSAKARTGALVELGAGAALDGDRKPVAPAAPEGRGTRMARAPEQVRAGAAVAFWVASLMTLAGRAPWLMRLVKPPALWFAWVSSANLRGATMANAGRLLGPASPVRERRRLARGVISSFFEFLFDLGRHRGKGWRELLGEIESVEGLEHYHAARAGGRGLIVVTAHLGSFETGVAAMRAREERVHVVFRRDGIGVFESLRAEQRRNLGVIEAAVDDGFGVWLRLREALAAGDVVMMQGDRTMPGQRGLLVPFFSGHLAAPTGPARLAMATGAAILPVFAPRTRDGRVRILMDTPLVLGPGGDADEATRRLARVIERRVREFPEQWLMTVPAWWEDASRMMDTSGPRHASRGAQRTP